MTLGQRNGVMREKDGEREGAGKRVGSLTFLWAMCVSSVNAFGFF